MPAVAMSSNSGRTSLWLVQRLRKAALGALLGGLLVALLFSDSHWRAEHHAFYEAIELFGALLIIICIFGRTWCTLYIGGRKKDEIVNVGPYSVTRNPLYIFTLIGAIGAGLQTGSLLVGLLAAIVTGLVFAFVVRREEVYLAAAFPEDFQAYAARVPRFFPRFGGWRDVDELVVKPRLVRQTFLDASLFLAAIPIADLIEWSQQAGYLPILVYLP